MANNRSANNELLKRNTVEKMILHHYNNTLLEQGLISEAQHRKMKIQISARKPLGVSGRADGPGLY